MALVAHSTNLISERVIGAAIEVHRHLGPGLLESSYHLCLSRELDLRKIPYRSRIPLPLVYKGVVCPRGYVADFVIADSLLVEIKSVESVLPIHMSQLLTYMRLQSASAGLLINFNVPLLPQGIRRLLL
jgi:GxxExxY protein